MATTEAMTRRSAMRTLAAFAVLAVSGERASASPAERAAALVSELSGRLLALVNSGVPEANIYREFERILATYADMGAVAASVLGPPWRGASAAQKEGFAAAFRSYVSRRYGKQFRDYQNARITIVRSRDAGRSGVLVQTEVVRPGKPTVSVEWQVSERSGQPKVVNLIIEGVSMLANERAEIGAQLEAQGGNLDALIAALGGKG